MTVSNAFSRPDQLPAKLRDEILAVADKLGSVGPDRTARSLASATASAVGLLLSDTLTCALTDQVAMAFPARIMAALITAIDRAKTRPGQPAQVLRAADRTRRPGRHGRSAAGVVVRAVGSLAGPEGAHRWDARAAARTGR